MSTFLGMKQTNRTGSKVGADLCRHDPGYNRWVSAGLPCCLLPWLPAGEPAADPWQLAAAAQPLRRCLLHCCCTRCCSPAHQHGCSYIGYCGSVVVVRVEVATVVIVWKGWKAETLCWP